MGRFLDWSAWLTTSVGLALLVIGLVLVPQGGVWADDPEPDPLLAGGVCSNSVCRLYGCSVSAGCQGDCDTSPADPRCKDCRCKGTAPLCECTANP
jgi:hypothetical protein